MGKSNFIKNLLLISILGIYALVLISCNNQQNNIKKNNQLPTQSQYINPVKESELYTVPFTIQYRLDGGIAGHADIYILDSNGEFIYRVFDKVLSKGKIDKKVLDKIREYAFKGNNFIDTTDVIVNNNEEDYPDKLTIEFTISVKNRIGYSKEESKIIALMYELKEKLKIEKIQK